MREKKQWLIVTFYTTSAAMAAEKACGQAGLPGRIIPVPREITADCGLGWRTDRVAVSVTVSGNRRIPYLYAVRKQKNAPLPVKSAAGRVRIEAQIVGWLAASMILTNFSGTREAPPIRPPSMSGWASRS